MLRKLRLFWIQENSILAKFLFFQFQFLNSFMSCFSLCVLGGGGKIPTLKVFPPCRRRRAEKKAFQILECTFVVLSSDDDCVMCWTMLSSKRVGKWSKSYVKTFSDTRSEGLIATWLEFWYLYGEVNSPSVLSPFRATLTGRNWKCSLKAFPVTQNVFLVFVFLFLRFMIIIFHSFFFSSLNEHTQHHDED